MLAAMPAHGIQSVARNEVLGVYLKRMTEDFACKQLCLQQLMRAQGIVCLEAPQEGRKEILVMRATTEVDWHGNVWSEHINQP